jgi:hypothetical protein
MKPATSPSRIHASIDMRTPVMARALASHA